MYQTYVDRNMYEWQNSYAYSSIVGEFLNLPIIKHETKFLMYQAYVDHDKYEW